MSVLDKRNAIVQQNIPKLIKSLTGFNVSYSVRFFISNIYILLFFKTNDENYNTCIQFTYSHLKYHRFLTINSHEIKREIDGICEKLRFSNFHDTEKKFRKLVEDSITHELAVNHYEKDVMYSILSLLATLAFDPINNLKSKLLIGEDIITFQPVSIQAPTKTSDVFIHSLLKDNFKLRRNETDSELSEWTDSDEEEVESNSQNMATAEEKEVSTSKTFFDINALKPPGKPTVFKTMCIENSKEWLQRNIQSSWWFDGLTSVEITSSHTMANFCDRWQNYLSIKSSGFIKQLPVSLISEYCLLREIFWMFANPVDCKFFKIDEDTISLRPNVTLPSTTPKSLNIFLAESVRSINLMHRLKSNCLKSYQSSSLSHTQESYFKIIQGILDEILNFILEEEDVVKSRKETYTIVSFHNKFQPHAKMLEMLWNIHETSVLDDSKYPPHICASYLLASLNYHVQISCTKEKKNLAIVLFMTCLRTYMEIVEIWWTQARLNDVKLEFLMERKNENGFETIQPRLLEKSKDKSFYLNKAISNKITENSIIAVMLSYSVKASFTLNIIRELDRVHEMRQIVNDSTPLYDEFVNKVSNDISKFTQQQRGAKNLKLKGKANNKVLKNRQLAEDIRNGMLANGDELLLLAFKSTFERLSNEKGMTPSEPSPFPTYDVLNNSSTFTLLPLEQSMWGIMNDLLSNKISIAERFVMNIYFHEFHIQQKFQEIRRVFFLSSELANIFYINLFSETGETLWANPYLLTVALNDAICSNRQNNSALFSVEVSRRFDHNSALEAVDGLTLYYNINKNLANVFTPKSMQKYNEGKFV